MLGGISMYQKNKFKLALCQTLTKDNKEYNVDKAIEFIKKASENNSDIVCLGEMFNTPYRTSLFNKNAEEEENSYTLQRISEAAKENKVYIVAGSICEKKDDKYYNTSYVFNREGNIIGKHKKIHLYDVDIKDKIKIKESDIISRGSDITVIDTEFCKIGLAICYDMRFPEIFRMMVDKGADLIIVPAAFNTVTGSSHWDTLIKSRSIDNQVYVAAVSPARNYNEEYIIYGHSKVCDPYGKTLGELDEKEGIMYCDIDLNYLNKIRDELPILKHRRDDIYSVVKLVNN
jgi:omega-amidase